MVLMMNLIMCTCMMMHVGTDDHGADSDNGDDSRQKAIVMLTKSNTKATTVSTLLSYSNLCFGQLAADGVLLILLTCRSLTMHCFNDVITIIP